VLAQSASVKPLTRVMSQVRTSARRVPDARLSPHVSKVEPAAKQQQPDGWTHLSS